MIYVLPRSCAAGEKHVALPEQRLPMESKGGVLAWSEG
jgi:hypothetical protein